MDADRTSDIISLLLEPRSFAASAAASIEVTTATGLLSCIPIAPAVARESRYGGNLCAEYTQDRGAGFRILGFVIMSPAAECLGDMLVAAPDAGSGIARLSHLCWRGTPEQRVAVIRAVSGWYREHLGAFETVPEALKEVGSTHEAVGPAPASASKESAPWIRTAGPSIGPRELISVADAARNGWNDRHDSYLALLCEELRAATGAQFVLPTSSCTGALHLSLAALGLRSGDEVLVPDITWIATASAVHYTGATPIPVPVDDRTWCLDADVVRDLLGPRTRAVIPVDLYGNPSDLSLIRDDLREAGVHIIHDAAASLGASVRGRPVGSEDSFACFSFQGAKTLVGGEGGALVTNDADLYERARKLNDHGRRPGTFFIDEVGMKYKMNNVTAALVYGQVKDRQRHISRKQQIRSWYEEFFAGTPVEMQEPTPNTQPTFWMNSARIRTEQTGAGNLLARDLASAGIDSRPVFPPISSFRLWSHREAYSSSNTIFDQSINIPSGISLNRRDIERVAESVITASQSILR